jgi:unsaturated chondroitin disaccharide hydrolase
MRRLSRLVGWMCGPATLLATLSLLLAVALASLETFASPSAAHADAVFRSQVLQTLAFAEQQLVDSIGEVDDPTRFPRSTDSSTGLWTTRSSSDWTAGFFPGELWLMYEYTGNPVLRSAAEQWTAGVAPQATNTGTHDVGFMIFNSSGQAYRITGDDGYRQTVLTAAASLDSRFSSVVGATRSWDFGSWSFPVIVDNMMNLELLFWSSKHGSDPMAMQQWSSHAVSHADVTIASHVRPNGSTFHVVDFDPVTGAILSQETHQGYQDWSTWARGQAWGLYGFVMAYRETHASNFLATAEALADYFLSNLPADQIPYWDFDAPNIPNEPRDSSAAAIAASGLLELSTLAGDPADRQIYRSAAEGILGSLMSSAYLSDGQVSSGILLHGTGNKPAGGEIDVSLIYGDYYLIEALVRYLALPPADPVPSARAPGLAVLGMLILCLARWRLRPARSSRRR